MLAAYSGSIIALSGTAVWRWRDALPASRDDDFIIPLAPSLSPSRADVGDSVYSELEQMIAANDPFRLANAPSAVAYDPATDGLPATVSPQPFHPTFALKAIVGGPPWQAIIDGIPGQPPGTVVGDGMVFGRLTIRNVFRDSVVIQDPDTMWVLTFRERS